MGLYKYVLSYEEQQEFKVFIISYSVCVWWELCIYCTPLMNTSCSDW